MKALFNSVKSYAVFASKPQQFIVGEPYQLGAISKNGGVFVELISGKESLFRSRVEQFGGVVLD